MAKQQIIDKMYHVVKTDFKNKSFSFDEIWKIVVKEDKLSKEEQQNNIGVVYTDMLQDARFIYIGNKKWMLREYATREEIERFKNALYDFAPVVEEYETPAKEETMSKDEEPITQKIHLDDDADDLDEDTTSTKSKNELREESEEE